MYTGKVLNYSLVLFKYYVKIIKQYVIAYPTLAFLKICKRRKVE